MEFKFNLGDKVKDTVTGFKGVVITRSQWLNNCNTYRVQPTKLKDGAIQKSEHFDEPQLVMIEPKVKESTRKTGGPARPVEATNR